MKAKLGQSVINKMIYNEDEEVVNKWLRKYEYTQKKNTSIKWPAVPLKKDTPYTLHIRYVEVQQIKIL